MKHWTELIFGEVFEKANHDKRKKGGDEWKHWFLDLLKVWKKISKDSKLFEFWIMSEAVATRI